MTSVSAVESEQKNRCVVHLRTTMWTDKNRMHIKRSLTFLRRQCKGFNVLKEDIDAVGVEEVLPRILNLDECEDGVYGVVTCNEIRNWETGYIEEYDYMLVTADTI